MSGDDNVGGIVGYTYADSGYQSSVGRVYATGAVSGNKNVGGLVGTTTTTGLYLSYATGPVSGSSNVGGLVGSNLGSINGTYWDEGTTNQGSAVGHNAGGTVQQTKGFGSVSDTAPAPEMQGASAESNMSTFDFQNAWETVEATHTDATVDGYPILRTLDRGTQLQAQGIAHPWVESIVRHSPDSPTNADSVTFTATFSEPVSGVTTYAFSPYLTFDVVSVESVSGTGDTYTVTVGDIDGDGTIRLDLVDNGDITGDDGYSLVRPGKNGDYDGDYTGDEVFTIDNTPPSVSGVTLTDDTDGNGLVTAGDTVQVTATVTDANGVGTVTADASAFDAGTVTLADDGPNSASGDDQYSATLVVGTAPVQGDQSVTVSATDVAGNGGSQAVASGTLAADTAPPSVSSVSVVDHADGNGVVTAGDTVEVTATVTDANGIATVTADAGTFDAGTITLADDGPNSTAGDDQYSATITVGATLADGEQSVTVNATDVAGNGGSQAIGSGTLTVDATAPIADASDSETVGVEYAAIGFDAGASVDAGTGIASYSWDFGDGTPTVTGETPTHTYVDPGDYTATLTVVDAAGNSASDAFTVTVNYTASPAITDYEVSTPSDDTIRVSFTSTRQLVTSEARVRGAASTSLGTSEFVETNNHDGSYTYTATYVVGEDGTYVVTLDRARTAAGTDLAGGESGSVVIDRIPPTIEEFSLTNPRGSTLVVTVRASEPLSTLSVPIYGPTDPDPLLDALIGLFDEHRENGSVVYEMRMVTPENGTHEAVLATAADAGGNDGATWQTDTATVATPSSDTRPPAIDEFEADATGDDVTVTLSADEPLARIDVLVEDSSGGRLTSLDESAFSPGGGANGTYRYEASFSTNRSGPLELTLSTAADVAGNDGAGNETVTVSPGDDAVDRADLNDDGAIDTAELGAAIDGWVNGEYTTDELRAIIRAWVASG